MVALVNRLTVWSRCKPIDECNGKPPPIGVRSARVKRLSQPIGCYAEQHTLCHIIGTAPQPFLVNFERIIAQIHSVRHDEIDNRRKVPIEHANISMQHGETLRNQILIAFWTSRREIRVRDGGRRERPYFGPILECLNQLGSNNLKRCFRNRITALAHEEPSFPQMSNSMLRF